MPVPRSIYRDIFKLEPGCMLTLNSCGGVPRLGAPMVVGDPAANPRADRYWNYAAVMRAGGCDRFQRPEEALEAVEQELASAIRGQAVSDASVGAFLFGGIDSSSVVVLYHRHSPIPVRTFNIGFAEDGFDEAVHARQVVEHLGIVDQELYVTFETRVPFLDHRLASIVARVPPALKVSPAAGKLVIKRLLARHLPPALVDRPKAGFTVPLDQWPRVAC